MFEWSKAIMEKIENGKQLEEQELRTVEIALRIYDVYEQALDEGLSCTEENFLELKHRI